MSKLSERLNEVMHELEIDGAKELATFCGVSEGLVSQWFSGKTKLGAKPLRAFARTRFNLDWITDGKLPKYRTSAPQATGEGASRAARLATDDVIMVPGSRVSFPSEGGVEFDLDETIDEIGYRASWFKGEGVTPDKARRLRVFGDSMTPLLYDRDTVIIDTEDKNVIDGKLYAIRYGHELRVRYVFRRLDGTLTLRSVNQNYPEEQVSPDIAREHIGIIGRVCSKAGNGGM